MSINIIFSILKHYLNLPFSIIMTKTNKDNDRMNLLIECHVGSAMYTVCIIQYVYTFLKLLDVQESRTLRGCASAHAHICTNAVTVTLTRVNVIIN